MREHLDALGVVARRFLSLHLPQLGDDWWEKGVVTTPLESWRCTAPELEAGQGNGWGSAAPGGAGTIPVARSRSSSALTACLTSFAALAWALLAGCSSGGTTTVPSAESANAGSAREAQVVSGEGVLLQTRTVGPADATDTLIAIHGGPGLSLEAMSMFESLAGPGRRVVSYDQRGAGRSTSPADLDYGLEVQVADLEAIRKALGVESVQLVGQSWGGAIAAAYAATYPQRVSALVLVGSVPLDRAEYLAGQRRFQDRVAELQQVGVIDDLIPPIDQGSCLDAFNAVLPAYLDDPTMRSQMTLTSCAADTSRATYEAFVADESVEELAKNLAAFESPVLLLAGEHDVFGPDWIARNRELLANASVEIVLIADAGHLVTAEQPKETMSAIMAFLQN